MDLLLRYLKPQWRLAALALLLAATNQVFSLLDPLIFRHIIDSYATKFHQYSIGQFIHGVLGLLGLAVGVAFISRVAKNFQDYYVNVIVQQTGAQLYADGVERSLSLPYAVFEDQRSGETLGKLQKVRTDVERFITAFVNIMFTATVGVIFVTVYAIKVDWIIAPAFLLTVPLLGIMSSVLGKKIKIIQKVIVAETAALAGSTTESLRNIELVKTLGLATQEISHSKNPEAGIEKGSLSPQPQLCAGHRRQSAPHQHPVPDALPHLYPAHHGWPVLLTLHLFVLHFWAAAGTRQHHQHLSRNRRVAECLRRDPENHAREEARSSGPPRPVEFTGIP
jgi:ABC-type multidrug transport system fused ATPase/permease subunit